MFNRNTFTNDKCYIRGICNYKTEKFKCLSIIDGFWIIYNVRQFPVKFKT